MKKENKWFVKCDDNFIEDCALIYVGQNIKSMSFEKYLYLKFNGLLSQSPFPKGKGLRDDFQE